MCSTARGPEQLTTCQGTVDREPHLLMWLHEAMESCPLLGNGGCRKVTHISLFTQTQDGAFQAGVHIKLEREETK